MASQEYFDWIGAVGPGLTGLLIVLVNARVAWGYWRKSEASSFVPLLGGVFFAAGLYALPPTRAWFWLGFLVDAGFWAFLWTLSGRVSERWQTRRGNGLHAWSHCSGDMSLEIRLYGGGRAVMRGNFEPHRSYQDGKVRVQGFRLCGCWKALNTGFRVVGYDGARVLELGESDGGWMSRESRYPADRPWPYDSLHGLPFTRIR
jgi:hypothetical protein